MSLLSSSLRAPKHNRELVITDRGWEDKDKGTIIVANKKLKEQVEEVVKEVETLKSYLPKPKSEEKPEAPFEEEKDDEFLDEIQNLEEKKPTTKKKPTSTKTKPKGRGKSSKK